MKQKVYAYITRERAGRTEVLVFSYAHEPESGTQVPGGSLEPGESPAEGALREVREEVRLTNPTVISHVGSFVWHCAPEGRHHLRHVYHVDAGAELPDSFETRCLSGSEDDGWLFRWRWMDAAEAAVSLFGQQGQYLPQLIGEKRTCPCCGYAALDRAYAVCPICYWQDWPDRTDPYQPLGKLSLYEAQQNYRATGAYAAWALPFVRTPDAADQRDPAWVAVPEPPAENYRTFTCPACGHGNRTYTSGAAGGWEIVVCAGCGRHGTAELRGASLKVKYPPDPTVTCPCCGYVTLTEPNAWQICPICFWEDEDTRGNPDAVTGANRISLRQAQQNYAQFGACDERDLRFVRPATPHDRQDPAWRPAE